MSLREQIQDDVKDAMRARDTERTTTLRMAVAALQREVIDARSDAAAVDASSGELTEERAIAVIQRLVKQRKEAAEAFAAGGRDEMAEKERREQAMLEQYLPAQLGDEELAAAVREEIERSGASGPADMGRVMGPLMKRFAGRLDGNRARQAVQAALKG